MKSMIVTLCFIVASATIDGTAGEKRGKSPLMMTTIDLWPP